MADRTQLLIPLSRGPLHHFFGYYGINAWDTSGTRHLALETMFHERRPTRADSARVGLLDATTGDLTFFGSTPAFNLQQGAMMFWIRAGEKREFTYNDWQNDQLVSQTVSPLSSKHRLLQGALSAVDNSHQRGLGLNYVRMWKCRPVVGYDLDNSDELKLAPDDDGIWEIDLVTGQKQLLISLAQIALLSASLKGWPGPDHGAVWCNHLLYSPAGKRVVFLARVVQAKHSRGRLDSLWMMNSDGSGLECLLDYRYRISHFCWLDEEHLLCSNNACDSTMQFTSINVSDGHCEPWGDGYMPQDGHPCLSPDGQWIACDTYPSNQSPSSIAEDNVLDLAGPPPETGRAAELFIYNPQERLKIILARPVHGDQFVGDIRCDLHPRWRPDGRLITIDSVHEGSRQIYGVDISRWTN